MDTALENSAINVAHCQRELEKAEEAVTLAKSNLQRAKDELIVRAIAFRSTDQNTPPMLGQPMPAMPAPPPKAPPALGLPPHSWDNR